MENKQTNKKGGKFISKSDNNFLVNVSVLGKETKKKEFLDCINKKSECFTYIFLQIQIVSYVFLRNN
jgi:hypothetical protein